MRENPILQNSVFAFAYGHLEERGFGASIETNFIVGSQIRQHKATNACAQAYFGMIWAA